ncbi:7-cyano-7-deazaguanine synthase [Prosthecochloris sp. ZM_2]|uniref:7-cyano-7-deazaguanine synthase n=1 Tax=Prosthecochloris sp. ZM_2 TaxID=2045206 RepID=UPI000E14E2DA|nr:7-cyano-7-deazaguanine synthase [Prosthecochloris sp. ZM_2]
MGSCKEVHLLWSGGWDSTFRLCDLLLVHNAVVQPHYIIDHTRKSLAHELRAVWRIRRALESRLPEFRQRLKPIHTVWMFDVPPDASVSENYQALTKRFDKFGPQYEWILRFAKHFGLENLELSVESNTFQENGLIWQMLRSMLVEQNGAFVVRPDPPDPDFEFFRPFSFPLIDVTKLQMMAYARDHGFYDIMENTWFCHSPRKGRPCGVCPPCRNALAEGMSHRVPVSGKLRNVQWKLRLRKR